MSGQKIFIYAVCPGFCATDLNDHATGARSPEIGADSILYVINTPVNELENGAFYQDEKKLPQVSLDEARVNAYIESAKRLFQSKQ